MGRQIMEGIYVEADMKSQIWGGRCGKADMGRRVWEGIYVEAYDSFFFKQCVVL